MRIRKKIMLFILFANNYFLFNNFLYAQIGNLNVTVQNINSNVVSGATVKRYNSNWQPIDQKTTGSNGVASWTNIAIGTYKVEAYYNGNKLPYTNDEFWGNGTGQVTSGNTANVTIKRYEPYTQSIVFKNNNTNEILNSSNPIAPNTTVRVEVTVKNQATVSRNVKVELLIDRDKVSSYDFNLALGPQTISANGGTYTFSTTFTPTADGLYYQGIKTESYIETGYLLTDTWAWSPTDGAFKVQSTTGNLSVTVQDINSNVVSGATVKRYNSNWQPIDQKTTGSNGVASWTNIAIGTYKVEAYYNGNKLPYTNDEFWGNGTGQVTSGNTANVTIKRYEPYTQSIVFKNNNTNEILNSSNPIAPNTTVRVEVTVKNQATVSRNVKVELLIDRDKVSSYDFNLALGPQTISANGGTYTFSTTFTPTADGLYYQGIKTESYIETGYLLTDTWAWRPTDGAFKVQKATNWILTWSDEFDGTSINQSDWTFDVGEDKWGNNELEYYTDSPLNSKIENGNLLIIARRESYGNKNYTSARLKTEAKKYFIYGKIEARIKMPMGQGLWPAFWMLGNNNSQVGYPKCGEIDIMEHLNSESKIYGTMHWVDPSALSNPVKWGNNVTLNDKNEYHVYSIEWNPNSIKWFLDGYNYLEGNITNNINSTEEFHLPFFIILNLAVGGDWPGSPDNFTPFPSYMYIDYVRVYQNSTTNLQNNYANIPDHISLSQNFPNPFNPSTTIRYSLSLQTHITLRISDVLGRTLVTLVNEEKMPGTYEVKYDASDLTTGIYFYQLISGQHQITKKLVLVK